MSQPAFDISENLPASIKDWNPDLGPLKIGLFTDLHYTEKETLGTREYFRTPQKVHDLVAELNTFGTHFNLCLGDWSDGSQVTPEDAVGERFPILRLLGELEAPRYGVAGNHDYYVPDEDKDLVLPLLGIPSAYYTFAVKGWRFIFLDAAQVSLHRYAVGSPEYVAAQALLDLVTGDPGTYPLAGTNPGNGALGATQLAWLGSWLTWAHDNGEKVVLVCHAPYFLGGTKSLWDADAVAALIRAQPDGVVALWLNGHTHHYALHDDAPSVNLLTIPGLVETDVRNFAILELFNPATPHAGMVVNGFGDCPDLELEAFIT
jgi:3',5'-cyclic AMP phosphodiesterase CpdA